MNLIVLTATGRSFPEAHGETPKKQPNAAQSERRDHYYWYLAVITLPDGESDFRCIWHESDAAAAAAVAEQLPPGESEFTLLGAESFIAAIGSIETKLKTAIGQAELGCYVVFCSCPHGLRFRILDVADRTSAKRCLAQDAVPPGGDLLIIEAAKLLWVAKALEEGTVDPVTSRIHSPK